MIENATILIVDDTPNNLRLLASVLSEGSYEVRSLRDGRMVLPSALNKCPDLILLDIRMPEMDGFEVCQQLKANERTSDIPVIFISALQDVEEKIKGFSLGAVDYITKPFQKEEVLARVHTHLSLQQLRMDLQQKNVQLQQEINERKRAEAEREKLQQRLQLGQKMEMIGKLTSGVAHNFNNMLTSILGYCDLARERISLKGDDKAVQYLDAIYQAGQRAAELVKKMQAYIHGAERLPAQTLNLHTLIDDVQKELSSVVPSTVDIQTEIQDEVIKLPIDAFSLQEIIMNLCLNANDAIDGEGEITIGVSMLENESGTCSSCYEDYSGDYIDLFVSDSGIGMEPDLVSRIFDPYFTSKELVEGLGLGLSIVHGVVHSCGGHIMVETKPGKGSTFHLLFPHSDTDKSADNS